MAELDLSLSDALTDGGPAPQEGVMERDFLKELEAEPYDDQVGETVGKTDYTPLLDNTAEAKQPLNGDQDIQKPGSKVTQGEPMSASRPEPQGEVRPHSTELPGFTQDFPSDSSQHAVGVNMAGGPGGVAPLQTERPQSVAEPQTPPSQTPQSPRHGSMAPEPQSPGTPLDLSAGEMSDRWPDNASLPFSPSVSTVISRHANQLATSPEDPQDSTWPPREGSGPPAGEEREDREEGGGGDRKQKKKKKRRAKEEQEERPHMGAQREDGLHRGSPRRDKTGEGGWGPEEGGGRSGDRGKRGKSRKKLPEEWGVSGEPFVPASQLCALQPGLFSEHPDDSLIPPSLTQDLLSLTAASPATALTSDLQPTAAPFSMPPPQTGCFPPAPRPDEPFSASSHHLLVDGERASPGDVTEPFSPSSPPSFCPSSPPSFSPSFPPSFPPSFSPSFSPGSEKGAQFGINSSITQPFMQEVCTDEGLVFAPDSTPLVSMETAGDVVVASAPPLTPSEVSWAMNNSLLSSDGQLFDFSDSMSPNCGPPGGLAFNIPSPAPLRSPKTTPESHTPKPSSQKKNRSSSSSSSNSLASKKSPPCDSPALSPSSPPSSALNPAAKPFFPTFSESPGGDPAMEVIKSEKMDKPEKEEKMDTFDMFEKLDQVETRGVTVKFDSAMGEKTHATEKEEERMQKTEKVLVTDKSGEVEKSGEVQNVDLIKKNDMADKIEKMDEDQKMDKEQRNVEQVETLDQMEKVQSSVRVEEAPGKPDTAFTSDASDLRKTQPEEEKKVAVGTAGEDKKQEADMVEKDLKEKKPEVDQQVKVEKDLKDKKPEVDQQVKVEKDLKDKKPEVDQQVKVEKDLKDKKPEVGQQVKVEKSEDKTSAEKKEKAAKADGVEKAKKMSTKPSTNGSSAALSKDPPSPDKKPKTSGSAPLPSRTATATKNGTVTTATAKPATLTRAPLASRMASSATAKRPLATKTNSKPAEDSKPGTLKTTTVDSARPSLARSSTATSPSGPTSRARPAPKPAVPASSTAAGPDRKPPVPRAPRPSATTGTAPRPSTAPAPDVRNARSKIGSTDNMKHQPGGGKVSGALGKTDSSSKETSQGKVQILSKKVDLSKVTSKCGSKTNIKHKPGGGDVKIEAHKVNFKAQSKIGSTDNLNHAQGGDNAKAEGRQDPAEGTGAAPGASPGPAPASQPGQPASPAQENGLKEGLPCGNLGLPCGNQGLQDTQGLDSLIPETSI
ncbi:microtubule-associated protein 4 isoform X7 [Hypomesus transpacificus]|uniref:microtubule-associated protein 4 isoform X7 n=1 Tax=Hypomesus transpacificus TaxID=137520 RepID=UPI001F072517|nr:microtubule-associated protein 4 isoform X7 [Hypomesus transpacificus]